MAAAIPLIATFAASASPYVAAGSALMSAQAKTNAANDNATVMGYEAKTAATQGYEAEAQQRRKTAMMEGSQIAAAAQAGAGFGGSTGRAITQNMRNATEDALSIRYKAHLAKWGYELQASNVTSEGQSEARSDYFRAGGALLKGYSGNYLG
jgi:hypothetical protein